MDIHTILITVMTAVIMEEDLQAAAVVIVLTIQEELNLLNKHKHRTEARKQ
jgi:hypothetical protein